MLWVFKECGYVVFKRCGYVWVFKGGVYVMGI